MVRPAALVGLIVVSFAAGCGEMPAASAKKAQRKVTATAVSQPVTFPKVEQDAYASVEAAMADVEAIASSKGENNSQKLRRIETWLDMQGTAIAPELDATIKDPTAGLAARLTACRVLTRLGPTATPTLLAAADGEPRQLRLKAIESLGRVKPTSAETVQKLVALIDDEENEIRGGALRSLAAIGPAVKEHSPDIVEKLILLLNNVDEDETVRSQSKGALKKIDPRTGLQGAY